MTKDEWGTPQELFDRLDALFGFTLDAAATVENAKCKRYFTKEDNGLARNWEGNVVWCNPPYSGDQLERWVKKICLEASGGTTIVALIPASTGNAWWTEWINQADVVVFIRKRIAFESPQRKGNAPFWSALVIYNSKEVPLESLRTFGSVWQPYRGRG